MLSSFNLRLVLVISDGKKEKKLSRIFNQLHILLRFKFYAFGSATNEIRDILGLDEKTRICTMLITSQHDVHELFKQLKEQLYFEKKATGIAVSIKINEMMKNESIENDSIERIKMEENNYSMILVAVNHGFSHDVMESAKKAGATGGTIFKACRSGLEETSFLGITLQEEQEIVSIIVSQSIKLNVMNEINEHFGMNSKAHGVICSLPVDEVLGIVQK